MAEVAKHTPGPWAVVPPNHWYAGSGYGVQAPTPEGPGFPTPSATGFYAMCCPPPHGKDKQNEQEANARLIAAAPELLEALIHLRNEAVADGLSARPGWDAFVSMADEAIAKATT